jgi:hypothetical protein
MPSIAILAMPIRVPRLPDQQIAARLLTSARTV